MPTYSTLFSNQLCRVRAYVYIVQVLFVFVFVFGCMHSVHVYGVLCVLCGAV